MQDDCIARVLSHLVHPYFLETAELVCKQFRRIIREYGLWPRMVLRKAVGMDDVVRCLTRHAHHTPHLQCISDDSSTVLPKLISSVQCLKYICEVSERERERLTLWPLCSSSEDNTDEHIGHLLSSTVRSTRTLSYWSSAGSLVRLI